ncbi:MAG: peptide-methionine (S)-S-oxide reductase MsrA [Desulfamplus sp.]|nr:peptide-methionine (S)-S-oxide reductase MsrA [Desulfamplus sp.]MBF0413873.1 peptide-methionine (S)-S-oxide reductase MsrA [Desulfamplus sp.]
MKDEYATFAGGCFWCMEAPFEEITGVKSVTSGYTGGHKANPTYEEVCSGKTGHCEAIQIVYDPALVNYEKLLDIFWRQIDPTDDGGSFVDRGSQYKSAIFYHNEQQKKEAQASKDKLEASGKFNAPIATKLIQLNTFYPAEEYHQNYYNKNSMRYKFYKIGSGRDEFIKKTWNSDE